MKHSDLQSFLDSYLTFDPKINIAKTDPYMTNGLMVKGREEVQKIGFAVSASLSVFEKARAAGCDAVIVHHTFNFPPYNHYDTIFQNRMAFLIRNDMSLFGYHFLLDAHPEVGNNVQILKTIEATPQKPFFFKGDPWGWTGTLQGQSFQVLYETLKPHLSPRTLHYAFGSEKIKKVVAVSGMGTPSPSMMQDLIENHIDLYITGEVHEWVQELFHEAKINFIGGGHYHTEMFGIKALMKKIKEKFASINIEWIDIPNDI